MELFKGGKLVLLILFMCTSSTAKIGGNGYASSSGQRNSAVSIARQIGYGIKRATYYLDTLIEKCNSFDDIENWIKFMDSYLKCDADAHPQQLKELGEEAHPVQRINLLCKHWTLKKKCSSRLATKLNSCLGSELEDGRAGANALRLADAHMKFLCAHRVEYSHNLHISTDTTSDEIIPPEKSPLKCYRDMEESVNNCILEKEMRKPLEKFCQKFQAARECLLEVSTNSCDVEDTQTFMEIMLDQIEFDVEC